MKRFALAVLLLVASILPAAAQTYYDIDVDLPAYPEMQPVPDSPVYYAPNVDSNYFFYDGLYWDYYNDGWYGNPDNRLQQPSYQILNAQAMWTSADDAWRVSVYGRNLLDEEYAVFLSAQANGDSFQYAPPCTYGFSVERRF